MKRAVESGGCWCAAVVGLLCCSVAAVWAGERATLVRGYTWSPQQPPTGRSTPHIGARQGRHVLKLRKYTEGYVDLGQGDDKALRFTGAFTVTAVAQITKQWPMKAALVSKWGYVQTGASYELGFTPARQVFFRLSGDGNGDAPGVEVIGDRVIPLEQRVVVTAVYAPGAALRVYADGELVGEQHVAVPATVYDSDVPVRLGPRMEGLLGGVWFHQGAMSGKEVAAWAEHVQDVLPVGTKFGDWKDLKRKIPKEPAAFLGTTPGVELLHEIDISAYAGSYLCPGDLNNDGKLDFLLYKNGSSYTVPGRLIALDHDGALLWEMGDTNLTTHAKAGKAAVGEPGTTPALRGIATVYDIDEDGKSEVIAELWEDETPYLIVADGATGAIERRIPSPLDMSIRQPAVKGLRQPGRSHPVIRIAHLDGPDAPPAIVLKYGVSNGIRCHAFALDATLQVKWHIPAGHHSMGHIPTVADVDGDGRDEIVLGHALADDDGTILWDRGEELTWHADCTAVAALQGGPEKQVLLSVCGVGPVYCLDTTGRTLWRRPREQIEHGQALWVGDFLDDEPGLEVMACMRGHVGAFATFRGRDGKTLAQFTHRRLEPAYPDFPTVVNWRSTKQQSLWIPQDRILVDGRGDIVAELGDYDAQVQKKLHCGTSWRPVGAQAFALDLCGDQRHELLLYEPYAGEAIFIFRNAEGEATPKPYLPQPGAYNIRSYF